MVSSFCERAIDEVIACNSTIQELCHRTTPEDILNLPPLLFYGHIDASIMKGLVDRVIANVMFQSKSFVKRPAIYRDTLKYSASAHHIEVDLTSDDTSIECLLSDFIPTVLSKTRSLAHVTGKHLVVMHGINVLSKAQTMAMRKILELTNLSYIMTLLPTHRNSHPQSLSALNEAIRSRVFHIRCHIPDDRLKHEHLDCEMLKKINNQLDTILVDQKTILTAFPNIRTISYTIEKYNIPWSQVLNVMIAKFQAKQMDVVDLIAMTARMDHMSKLSNNPAVCLQRLLVYAYERLHTKTPKTKPKTAPQRRTRKSVP
jgi:hypothetical protein